ncbi:MAG: tetratricopeptide repeat protein [Alphaproteobacteria bacterium]|nr:tetratricopeptide repeat protein [Alphaproteobacteria bacterium]
MTTTAALDDREVAALKQTAAARPHDVRAHVALIERLMQAGRLVEAAAACDAAAAAVPEDGAIDFLRGTIEIASGRWNEAERHLQQAVARRPEMAGAWNNLGGTLVHLGRHAQAASALQRALALLPAGASDRPDTLANLGVALAASGRAEEGIASLREAVAAAPRAAGAYINLGNALRSAGRTEEAKAAYGDALRLHPEHPDALNNLGIISKNEGRIGTAIAQFEGALRGKPGLAEARMNLAGALQAQARHEEARAALAGALALDPGNAALLSNACLSSLYDAQEPQEPDRLALLWRERCERSRRAHRAPHANSRDPDRTLTIGYVSPDLRHHSVATFLLPVLRAHDRERHRIILYAANPRPDAMTEKLAAAADGFRLIAHAGDEEAEATVRADGVDVLVDLAGHTAGNRLTLFARRPAPVQLTWLGYPYATGLEAFDARLSDAIADPPGSDRPGLEPTWRLAGGFHAFVADAELPEPGPLPCAAGQPPVFGSFNMLPKLTGATIELWAQVLRAVPAARLVLKSHGLDDRETADRVQAAFTGRGIAADRVECVGYLPDRAAHLALYGRIDVALDPFPYNGTTTTCEALAMGVPVVTLAGALHPGRVGASLLDAVGMPELVARDQESYVSIARNLVSDRANLAVIRAGLRSRLARSRLGDARRLAGEIESAARSLWQGWCRSSAHPASLAAQADALHQRALEFERSGNRSAALAVWNEAIRLRPDDPDIIEGAGRQLLGLGKHTLAVAMLRRAAALRPTSPSIAFAHSVACIGAGDATAAEAAIDRLLAAVPGVDPRERGLALHYRGNARAMVARWAEAEADFREAARLCPTEARIWLNLGVLLVKDDRPDEALVALETAARLRADDYEVQYNRGNALKNAGRLAEAIDAFDRAIALRGAGSAAGSNALITATAHDGFAPDEVRRRHVDVGAAIAAAAGAPVVRPPARPRDRGAPLSIGYLSGDFRTHSVAYFLAPLLDAHDPAAVAVTCYSTVVVPDATTDAFRAICASKGWRWSDVRAIDPIALADSIAGDGIDVLVDLSGHTADHRLATFARRPAPVQVSYLGYANTTGVPGIGWRITDATADPDEPRFDRLHSERLVRLPRCFLAYRPPADAPAPSQRPEGHVVFGSFNNLTKLTPTTVSLWARAMRATPQSRLVLKSSPLKDPGVRRRVAQSFAEHGVPRDRIEMLPHSESRSGHLELYASIDIALDTTPYAGTTTTCEATLMGVPVVTLAGDAHAGRVGASLLSAIGLPDLVARSHDDFVRIAADLARNAARRRTLRTALPRMLRDSPLGDADGLARAIEGAFRMAAAAALDGAHAR